MDELLDLLEYHRWATGRVLEAVSKLAPDTYTRELVSSFPSVRDTLVHTFGADRAWLGRVEGQAPPRAEPSGYPEIGGLRADWMGVLARWPEAVRNLGDADAPVAYQSFAGDPFSSSLGEIVRQVVNHGTYHFGQVTTMLRQLGAQAVNLDLIAYYRTKAR